MCSEAVFMCILFEGYFFFAHEPKIYEREDYLELVLSESEKNRSEND